MKKLLLWNNEDFNFILISMSQTHLNQLLMMIKDRKFEENEDRRQASHIGGCGLGGQGRTPMHASGNYKEPVTNFFPVKGN